MQSHRIHGKGDAGREAPVALKLGELASFRVQPGQRVRCQRGSVWITIDNGGRDHVLNAGGQLRLKMGGCLVIEALMPSEIELLPALAPSPADTQQPALQRRAIMKLIKPAAPNLRLRKIWNVEFNKDSIATALVLAASLFILLFASATAAVQDGGRLVAPQVQAQAQAHAGGSPGAEARQLAERVSASTDGSAKCRSAKLC